MSSIFLRIYGGLLFTLVLVAVLSGLTLTIINGMRLQDFREAVVKGTFYMMSKELAALPEAEWSERLQLWDGMLGIGLSVESNNDDLGKPSRNQLASGRILIRSGDEDFEVFSAINEHQLLRGNISYLGEQLATGTVVLLRNWLNDIPPALRSSSLVQYQDKFGYPVVLSEELPKVLNARQSAILNKGYVVASFSQTGSRVDVYSALADSGQVLSISPVMTLNPYPFKLLATIGLFVLASISVAIYVLGRGLERRLSKLERAAIRLARGDLDTRVKLHGNDSVGQLAVAFNNMASHIQRLLSIQKEMIQGISHELRTPVARVRFALEMVLDAQSGAERESYVRGIDGDIEELDHLIDEILTYARLEGGVPDIHFERMEIDKIAARVVAEHQRQKGVITVTYMPGSLLDPLRRVDAEERYIHRAVQNLVGNACRHANTRVEVRVSVGHDNCRIDVEDDGPGIPEHQRERVFTAFARLDDSRTRASGGYGLGLSIVRRIMHWHNGTAVVTTSERLGGARFSLIWPRRQRGR